MHSNSARIDELSEQIAKTASLLDSGEHRLLTQIRQFDALEGWAWHCALSCAQWLSWRIGMGIAAARERVRVARALGTLPIIDALMQSGQLSYCKVRALTRVATPENEQELANIARHCTGSQLETICRLYRGVLDSARSPEEQSAAESEIQLRRRFTTQYTQAGTVVLRAELPIDEAHMLVQAIEARQDALRNEALASRSDTSSTSPPPPKVTRIDALADLVQGGRAPEVQVRLHVSSASLAAPSNTHPPAAEPAHLDFSEGISTATARRLCCDAPITPVHEDADGQFSLGRTRRCISPAMRKALELRDAGRCRFPGCDHQRHLQAHHIEHWGQGGPTQLDNLVTLCTAHHRMLHEGGYSMSVCDDDSLEVFDARGRRLERAPAPPLINEDALDALDAAARKDGFDISAETNACLWDGTPPDYAWIVSAWAESEERRRLTGESDRAALAETEPTGIAPDGGARVDCVPA